MQSEKILQYIWQHRLFDEREMKTTDGIPLEIIDAGRLNTDAGPDFFNAKIKIGNETWAGNIEIHRTTSDWKQHGHSSDAAYDSVILHVVEKADDILRRKSGAEIPQTELKFSDEIVEKINLFANKTCSYPCEKELKSLSPIFVSSWLNALVVSRMMRKSKQIDLLLEQSKNNWAETFYISLARSFGFGLNSDAFERLAKSVPLICLQKHRNNLVQIEALLFGMAGLLPNSTTDEYVQKLKSEANFLMLKFGLSPAQNLNWKMAKLRPQNFPYVRIAQFSQLIFHSSSLISKILEAKNYDEIEKLFADTSPQGYWETHCTFAKESPASHKRLGKESIRIIFINTIAPFLFSYAKQTGNDTLQEKVLGMLENLDAEHNNIVNRWAEMGIRAKNAADSQALLELQKEHCDKKDCLRCRIGHKIICFGK